MREKMNKKTIFGIFCSIIVLLVGLSLIKINNTKTNEEYSFWKSDKEMFDFLKKLQRSDKYKKEEIIITKNTIKIILNDNKNNNFFLENTLTRFISKEGVNLISSLGSIEIISKRNNDMFQNISHTNGNNNYCKIILGYKPLEEWSEGYHPQKKLLFSLTHELSHCLLGKEIFKKGVEWDLSIEKEIDNKINKYLLEKSNKSWILSQVGKKEINPLIVYHETFADIFTIFYLYENKILLENDILKILNQRKQNCLKTKLCYYKAYDAKDEILKILKMMNENLFNIEELYYFSNIFTQKIVLKNLD
jgi:hypothetical protein